MIRPLSWIAKLSKTATHPQELARNFSPCWPRFRSKLMYLARKSHAQVSSEPAKDDESHILEAIKQLFLRQTREISRDLILDLGRVLGEEGDLQGAFQCPALILGRM